MIPSWTISRSVALWRPGRDITAPSSFFPKRGKYHLDGHRNCQVRLLPHQTKQLEGRCPECGKPLTVGVMHRVDDLADRRRRHPAGNCRRSPEPRSPPRDIIRNPACGPEEQKGGPTLRRPCSTNWGPNCNLINDMPLEDIRNSGGYAYCRGHLPAAQTRSDPRRRLMTACTEPSSCFERKNCARRRAARHCSHRSPRLR